MPIYGIFYKHALPLIFRFRYTQKNTRSYCPGHSWIEVLFFAVRCSLFAVRCDNSQLRTTEQPNNRTPLLLSYCFATTTFWAVRWPWLTIVR